MIRYKLERVEGAITKLGAPSDVLKWVTSLESDKYTQHSGEMCKVDDPLSACCLQVAALEVDGITHQDSIFLDNAGTYIAHGLPDDLHVNAKFATNAQSTYIAEIKSLGLQFQFSEMNDDLDLSFVQIASIIKGGSVDLDESVVAWFIRGSGEQDEN